MGGKSILFPLRPPPKNDPHEITFTIQKLGDFTKKIPSVQIGTRVYLEGPYGQFDRIIRKLPKDQPLVFYGLGSGLAPLLSLGEQYGNQRQIKILWSSSKKNGLYFEKALEKLKKNHYGYCKRRSFYGRINKKRIVT